MLSTFPGIRGRFKSRGAMPYLLIHVFQENYMQIWLLNTFIRLILNFNHMYILWWNFGPIQHATLPPRHESFFPRVLIGNNFLNLFSILDAYMYLIFLGKNTSQFWQKWQSGGIPPPPQSMHIFSSHFLIMRHHNRHQKYQNFMFDPWTAPGFKFCSQPLPDPWIF